MRLVATILPLAALGTVSLKNTMLKVKIINVRYLMGFKIRWVVFFVQLVTWKYLQIYLSQVSGLQHTGTIMNLVGFYAVASPLYFG